MLTHRQRSHRGGSIKPKENKWTTDPATCHFPTAAVASSSSSSSTRLSQSPAMLPEGKNVENETERTEQEQPPVPAAVPAATQSRSRHQMNAGASLRYYDTHIDRLYCSGRKIQTVRLPGMKDGEKNECEWMLQHALREIVQNVLDAVLYHLKAKHGDSFFTKENTFIRQVSEDDVRIVRFDQEANAPTDDVLARFFFDRARSRLLVSNSGRILLRHMSMGGGDKGELPIDELEQVIGRFGDGLKVALVVLLRGDNYEQQGTEGFKPDSHPVKIHTGEETWTFALRNPSEYDPTQTTLQFTISPRQKCCGEFALGDSTKFVTIEISKFTLAHWNIFPDRFIEFRRARDAFCGYDSIQAIPINADKIYAIYLHPDLKGCVFAKGLFVMKLKGLNFAVDLNIPLDRDRMAIIDYPQFQLLLARLHAELLERYEELSSDGSPTSQEFASRYLPDIYQDLSRNAFETYVLYGQIQPRGARVLFEYFEDVAVQKFRAENAEPLPTGAYIQPHCYPDQANRQTAERRIDHVYFVIASSDRLFHTLARAAGKYFSIDAAHQDYVQKHQSQTWQPTPEQQKAIDRAVALHNATGLATAITSDHIKVLDTDPSVYFRNGNQTFIARGRLDCPPKGMKPHFHLLSILLPPKSDWGQVLSQLADNAPELLTTPL
eukprot:m.68862 g.68862  ORF g.68862 m.68862 type:complete len:663 (-) comp7775_c0_seq1:146-2134(-)